MCGKHTLHFLSHSFSISHCFHVLHQQTNCITLSFSLSHSYTHTQVAFLFSTPNCLSCHHRRHKPQFYQTSYHRYKSSSFSINFADMSTTIHHQQLPQNSMSSWCITLAHFVPYFPIVASNILFESHENVGTVPNSLHRNVQVKWQLLWRQPLTVLKISNLRLNKSPFFLLYIHSHSNTIICPVQSSPAQPSPMDWTLQVQVHILKLHSFCHHDAFDITCPSMSHLHSCPLLSYIYNSKHLLRDKYLSI